MAHAPPPPSLSPDALQARLGDLRQALGRVVIGQESIVKALLTALLCRGHVLIVGVPGLAKTLLVRTLAAATDLSFSRIQFTPDMMPSDILGVELVEEDAATRSRSLRFVRGPVFAQLILADEINRTPPRTQAALLEAMAEHQVTVGGRTLRLEEPFLVVATQNPIEQEGTYPLPEAQLDRFMFSLWMDYPSLGEEKQVVAQARRIQGQAVEPVMTRSQLLQLTEQVAAMPVSEHVVDYAVRVVRATRPGEPGAPEPTRRYVSWGAGPRAGQFLVHAAQALAAMAGEPAPGCVHVREAAMHVLRHRIVMNYAATGEGLGSADIVRAVLDYVKEADYA